MVSIALSEQNDTNCPSSDIPADAHTVPQSSRLQFQLQCQAAVGERSELDGSLQRCPSPRAPRIVQFVATSAELPVHATNHRPIQRACAHKWPNHSADDHQPRTWIFSTSPLPSSSATPALYPNQASVAPNQWPGTAGCWATHFWQQTRPFPAHSRNPSVSQGRSRLPWAFSVLQRFSAVVPEWMAFVRPQRHMPHQCRTRLPVRCTEWLLRSEFSVRVSF